MGVPDEEVSVRVRQQRGEDGSHRVELLDEAGEPIEVVSGFLRFLAARDFSPNTLASYAYDLRHLWRFLNRDGLTWEEFAPRHAIALLEYLRSVPSRRPRRRMTLTVATIDAAGPATKLAAATVNRILAAVSSFYEYVIMAGLFDRLNPIEKRPDPALQRVSERHRPFMGAATGRARAG
jgi:site-specific recombinase XerD